MLRVTTIPPLPLGSAAPVHLVQDAPAIHSFRGERRARRSSIHNERKIRCMGPKFKPKTQDAIWSIMKMSALKLPILLLCATFVQSHRTSRSLDESKESLKATLAPIVEELMAERVSF